MRVDSNYVQSLVSALASTTASEQTLSTQLSSGLRITALSDDPSAVARGVQMGSAAAADTSFTQAAATVQARMQASDSALSEVVSQVTSALTIATQAANGTQNASNQQVAAQQIASIRDQVLSLANSAYAGQYLFGGTQSGTQPFTLDNSTSPATVTYNGDTTSAMIATSTGQTLATGLAGSTVFTASGADLLGSLNTLIADISSGSTTAISADVSSLTNALTQVTTQRASLDSNLSRLGSAVTYAQNDATQQTATQSTLLSSDLSSVATQLSAVKTQQEALMSVVSVLQKGSLFDYVK